MSTEASTSDMLIPSQAISRQNSNMANPKPFKSKRRPRRSHKMKDGNNKIGDNGGESCDVVTPDSSRMKAMMQRQRKNNGKRSKSKQGTKAGEDLANSLASNKDIPPRQGGNSNKRKQQNKKSNKFPWRRLLNDNVVDPITLEPLNSLAYPPFALCADSPYVPVPEWPVPELVTDSTLKTETVEERQKRLLREQWGSIPINVDLDRTEDISESIPLNNRKMNLFDGRALAYYMVSQLQFIDPLTRRDLTRDELVNLDHYLRRSGFNDLNVTEAYDGRGITLSLAGASASTVEGRALIRQQEIQRLAQSLLNNIFSGRSVSSQRTTSNDTSSLLAQYTASQRQDDQGNRRNRGNQIYHSPEDRGIYGSEETGLMIIDDDANPGLRGVGSLPHGVLLNTPITNPATAGASSNYVSHSESIEAVNFPTLTSTIAPQATVPPVQEITPTSVKNPPSRSLAKITKVVKKTSEKELQKQREARELFIKRAEMSNQAFGEDRSEIQAPSGLMLPPSSSAGASGPTETQLTRNQAFASALGIAPATLRNHNINQGWARPADSVPDLDEFGNELATTNYPDALIIQARERMPFLLKLEKKLSTFLADDSAASLPLNKMDRALRTFVHAYSDFWSLHTESFDPEPNRYIHCVKLRDTRAPRPLLSVAAHNWRGPNPVVTDGTDHSLRQTAGQTPREFPAPPERLPLQLMPRGAPQSSSRGPPADTESYGQINSRSQELFIGRERPRLALAPRTLPVELPAAEKGYSLVEERERQKALREEKDRIDKEMQEAHRRRLEAVYASESDEKSLKSHDSDEWEDLEGEEEYSGSDYEEND